MNHTLPPTLEATARDETAVGQSLDRYKLLERLGEGGCGVVYVAEQTEPVRRRVALKVIKLGMDTKAVVARFEAERQALAMVAPEFQDLIGATEAQRALAQTSVCFLESLGGSNGGDEAFQAELAKFYGHLANALGNPYAPNTTGDYTNALRFATQTLMIEGNLQKKHPNDQELLRRLALTEGSFGSILAMLGRTDEALVHHRRSLELFRQFLNKNPGGADFEHWVSTENFKIGNDLMDQGRAQEALEQHYLPYGKQRLDRAVDPTLGSKEAHGSFVAHLVVGLAEMRLERPATALPHFGAALRWKKMQVDLEPNNARYARDWSQIHREIGATQVALGQYNSGLTNLQEAVRLAENILARNPMNGSFQSLLIDCLHGQAKAVAKIARSDETSRTRRAELWLQASQVLSRCQERPASPEMAQVRMLEGETAKEIARALDEARAPLAKLASGSGSHPAKP